MCTQYGLNRTEMLLVWDTFTEMYTYISGGNTGTFSNSDLITGFFSPMALRISDPARDNFLAGDAIYYSPYVTPAITNYVGPLSKQKFTTYTGVGEGQVENIAGRIIAQNGVNFPNQNFLVYNGQEIVYTQVPIYTDQDQNGAANNDFSTLVVFDGQQNAPVYSTDKPNTNATYIYDANNLLNVELNYVPDSNSFICQNGTGIE